MTKKTFIALTFALILIPTVALQAQSKTSTTSTTSKTTTTSMYVFTTNIWIGMRGTAVTELQKRLTVLGVYSGPITGYYGSLTKAAVMLLQSKNHLEVVGTVGPQTRALLNAVTTNTTNQPAPTTSPSTSTTVPKIPSTPTPTPKPTPTPTPTPTPNPIPVPIPTPIPTPVPAPQPTTSTGMKWGMFMGSGAGTVSSLATTLGKTPDITAIFAPWTDSFPTYMNSVCSSSKTLLIFWENYGYSLDNIINGTYDSYLKSWSQGAAAYKCPVIVSLFHEMNGNWDDWDGTVGNNTPAKVVSAWKHVHDIVTAPNIKWAWAVNNESVPNTSANAIENYYPGDAYVDYVAIDGFNFGSPWQSFGQVFDTAVAKVTKYNKPLYILSVASADGSQKAAWITEGLGSHIKTYPKIAGWVWFNEQKERNWLVSSDAASLAAFKSVLP